MIVVDDDINGSLLTMMIDNNEGMRKNYNTTNKMRFVVSHEALTKCSLL